MYAESFQTTDQPLPSLLSKIIATIEAEGAVAIECADLVQKAPNVLILAPDSFVTFLRAVKPSTVFVYAASFDVQQAVADAFDGQDGNRRKADFMRQHANLVKAAEHESGGLIYIEALALHESHAISLGYASDACQRLLAAIEKFEAAANDEVETAREAELERVTRDLLRDAEFAAIRGKRKRCVYVATKYGDSLFSTGYLARPDARSDPMDRDLVELVERASDLLSLGLEP